VATQRPSVNVITGVIKANFPARLSFRVTSKIDSRTILDTGGADQLVGQGDMLLSAGSEIIRLQSPFVDTPELDKIVDFIGEQRGYPQAFLLPEYIDEKELEGLEPKASREIDIKHFVPPQAIAPEFYDRPYYLGPDGDQAAYFALAEALRKENKEGVAHWVMRKQPYVGALRAEDDYLMLFTLRSSDEVVSAK